MERPPAAILALAALAGAAAGCAGPAVHPPTASRWLLPETGRASATLPDLPPPTAERPLRIAVYGDSRGNRPAHRAVVAAVREARPDLVVHTGDAVQCFPAGHAPDHGPLGYLVPFWPQVKRGYPLATLGSLLPFPRILHEVLLSPWLPVRDPDGWNGFLEDTAPLRQEDRIPFLLAPGNHDLYHDADAAEVGRLFGEPGGEGGHDRDALWFAVDLPGLRLIVLDTGSDLFLDRDPLDPASGQAAWLERELAGARAGGRVPLVALHIPPWSSGEEDGPCPAVQERIARPLLEAGGVPLVLCGHAHAYERLVRARPDGGTTTYAVTGGGGAPFHHLAPPGERDPASRAGAERTLHFLLLEVLPGRIRATVRAVPGTGGGGGEGLLDAFEVALPSPAPRGR